MDIAAVLAAAYSHGPGKTTPVDPVAPAHRPVRRGPGVPLGAVADAGPFGAAVAGVLRRALTPRRWEPWNKYNDHRAYPSARSAFAVEVSMLVGADRWVVDPVRDRLFGGAGPAAVPGSGTVVLEASPVPDRLPPTYGSLVYALAWLEAGHVVAALVEAATAHEVTARSTMVGTGVRLVLSAGTSPSAPPAVDPDRRTAGLGPRGLGVDPRPLPGSVMTALVRARAGAPPGSPATWPGLRHVAAVRGVTGYADGTYAVGGSVPTLQADGNVMDAVADAFTYPPSSVDTAGMNVAWVMTGAVDAAVRATGETAYRRLLVTAGATAQHIATAAGAEGLFCRPCRSVREAPLEAVTAAPIDHDFLYLLLIGRSRVRDFRYDLT